MSLDVYLEVEGEVVYEANITHNLNSMAGAAGIYKVLWRPEEIGLTKAVELIPYLEQGLTLLICNKAEYEEYNPSNGWGTWHYFVIWCSTYLQACRDYPHAKITVSR